MVRAVTSLLHLYFCCTVSLCVCVHVCGRVPFYYWKSSVLFIHSFIRSPSSMHLCIFVKSSSLATAFHFFCRRVCVHVYVFHSALRYFDTCVCFVCFHFMHTALALLDVHFALPHVCFSCAWYLNWLERVTVNAMTPSSSTPHKRLYFLACARERAPCDVYKSIVSVRLCLCLCSLKRVL